MQVTGQAAVGACIIARENAELGNRQHLPRAEGERQVRQLLEVVGLQELQRGFARRTTAAQHRLEPALRAH
jgi:hypothetical protein